MEQAFRHPDELIKEYIEQYPELFYETLLTGPMLQIYSAKKETTVSAWEGYANLLLDKFAIHSMSFFHLSQGIVERRMDNTLRKSKGYDLFSVNALFRVMIETYIAFHWIFVAPKKPEEKKFRFLLWKLDGLFEKRKFEFSPAVKEEAADLLAQDEQDIRDAIQQLQQNAYYRSLSAQQLEKVFDQVKKRAIWKYEVKANGELRQLKIIELVQIICRLDGFLNQYRYASLYTHSGYFSIEKFRQMRGKPVEDSYANPLLKLAIYLTALVIEDMCLTDHLAAGAFGQQDYYIQRFVTQMNHAIKSVPIRPVR